MRTTLLFTGALLASLSTMGSAQASVGGGHVHAAPQAVAEPAARPGDEALIANALSAAPASVAAIASVMTFDGRVLRRGTGDWVCMPDMPDVPNNSPMCLDAPWRALVHAHMTKQRPSVTQVGFGYMLQGDMPVSNIDPFAQAPTPTNQWLPNSGPHVMVLLPDHRLLEGLPTDPANGGPYVMWKGTPYAHIMVPMPPAPAPR